MSDPIARLSSLDLIRGFVAVGRRMSITLAAQDLYITQSAVSRQIRALEDMLGVKLLTRGHRSISFTTEGDRLFRSADSAVQQLQDAIGAIRVGAVRQPVTITCTIGFASLWLLPRLRNFQQQHPGVDVRIAASDRVEDLRGEGIDLAVRYCARKTAPEGAVRLFGETVVAVAHPAIGIDSLDSPRCLERQILLEFEGARLSWLHWHEWLVTQGWDKVKPKGTLRFNQYDQVITAAVAGQGIAIGRLPLLGAMLSDGRLKVLPGAQPGPATSHAYWLIRARENPRSDVTTAARWIQAQAAAESAGEAGAAPGTVGARGSGARRKIRGKALGKTTARATPR